MYLGHMQYEENIKDEHTHGLNVLLDTQ